MPKIHIKEKTGARHSLPGVSRKADRPSLELGPKMQPEHPWWSLYVVREELLANTNFMWFPHCLYQISLKSFYFISKRCRWSEWKPPLILAFCELSCAANCWWRDGLFSWIVIPSQVLSPMKSPSSVTVNQEAHRKLNFVLLFGIFQLHINEWAMKCAQLWVRLQIHWYPQ